MKSYAEHCALSGSDCFYLPKGFENVLQIHPKQDVVRKFQNWRTFQRVLVVGGIEIKAWGGLDNLLLYKDGKVAAWDFKSKGKIPDMGYSEKYYQTQADMCHLLLEGQTVDGQQLVSAGVQFFTYAFPVASTGRAEMIFDYLTVSISSDPERAKKLLYDASVCLSGDMPASSETCEQCQYIESRKQYA